MLADQPNKNSTSTVLDFTPDPSISYHIMAANGGDSDVSINSLAFKIALSPTASLSLLAESTISSIPSVPLSTTQSPTITVQPTPLSAPPAFPSSFATRSFESSPQATSASGTVVMQSSDGLSYSAVVGLGVGLGLGLPLLLTAIVVGSILLYRNRKDRGMATCPPAGPAMGDGYYKPHAAGQANVHEPRTNMTGPYGTDLG